MSYHSRLPLARTSSVALVAAAGFYATFGVTVAAADPGGDRLGCGTFCENAGGYGGAGPPPSRYAVTVVPSGTVTLDEDGYIPVTLACHLSSRCDGVVIVSGPSFSGRSDLVVDAGATRTIAVPLGPSAIDYLRSNGPTSLYVTTDATQSSGLDEQGGGPAGVNLHDEITATAPG